MRFFLQDIKMVFVSDYYGQEMIFFIIIIQYFGVGESKVEIRLSVKGCVQC